MLKQLIQRLLDSRTTPAQAVQADRINISTETTFSTDEFVPPRDGFVRAWGKVQQGLEGTAIALNVSNGTTVQGISRLAFTGPSSANDIVQTWPVRKGEAISLSFFNIDVQLRTFYDAIGGGYLRSFVSAVCKRGELCLSRLSLCLPRSFCKVKSLGLQNSVLRLSAMALTFLARVLPTSLAMLRHATAGQPLEAIQAQSQLLKFKSRMDRWRLPPSSTETPQGVVFAVTSKKEPLLNSYAEVERLRIILFGSTKQVQMLNSLVGGALC